MAIKFTNNASSKLTQALTTSATSMRIKAEDVSKFPVLGAGDYCLLTIVGDNGNHEIVKVTNISSDGTCTIERAQDSTTAKEWPVDNRVELRITAEYLNSTADNEEITSSITNIESDISSIKNNITDVENDILNIESDISSLSSTQEEIINTTIPSLPDNVTISFEGDKLQVKDVAIDGDSSDLASTRGIFNSLGIGARDFNTITKQGIYSIPSSGSTNGPGFACRLVCYTTNGNIITHIAFGNNNKIAIRTFESSEWSNWILFINENSVGDGITANNGILSVPEYEGATSSATATSGLVPPATSAERNNFLRGDGTWQQVDLSDYALKTELTKYLPLTGGTITGTVLTSSNATLHRVGTDGFLQLGMETVVNGGQLNLFGKDYTNTEVSGGFQLLTGNGASTISLEGTPNGALTWNGKNIVRSVGGVEADTSGNVNAPYLPLTGGTLTGTYPTIRKNNTTSGIIINGGTKLDDGASLYLYGKDREGSGWCQIITRDTNAEGASLVLRPSGSLTWNAKNIVRSVNNINADTNGNISLPLPYFPIGGTYSLNRPTKEFGIGVGTSWNNAPSFTLYGTERTDGNAGMFSLRAKSSSSTMTELIGRPSGQLTWSRKNIVRSVNGINANTDGNVTLSTISSAVNGVAMFSNSGSTRTHSGGMYEDHGVIRLPNYGTWRYTSFTYDAGNLIGETKDAAGGTSLGSSFSIHRIIAIRVA